MYAELYSYILLYKKLSVPGIGTFLLQRQSAISDFSNKIISPPSFTIGFENEHSTPSISFFKKLAAVLSTTDHDAIRQFNDFSFEFKKHVDNGNIINWNEVGTISKGLGGEIKFVPIQKIILEEPVIAEKVIREKAEHFVRVGEEEKTSEEMKIYLNREEEKKTYWWAIALVIGLLSVMFLGWYFSKNGVAISSTKNNKKLTPLETPSTYKLLP